MTFLKKQAKPQYDDSVTREEPQGGAAEEGAAEADVDPVYDQAVRLLQTEHYKPAIDLLVKVSGKAPALAAAHLDLGIAYSRTGDLDRLSRQQNRLWRIVIRRGGQQMSVELRG